MSDRAGKAVFLSYASEDVEAALRICEALRKGDVEVWLDQEGGLVGGDAWDRKIRAQIGLCVLFIAIISANTQARREGYFRLEWHLAEERVRLIAKGVPFIVPVSIDGTNERGALVPDAFLAVQWTRIGSADSLPAFCERVKILLGREVGDAPSRLAARPLAQAQGGSASGPPTEPLLWTEVPAKNFDLPGVVRPALESTFETAGPAAPGAAVMAPRAAWRRALPFAVTAAAALLVAGLAAWRLWPSAATPPSARFRYILPDGQEMRRAATAFLAVAPDGRAFIYNTEKGLYLRKLSELEAHVIPGTEETLSAPFFSPDGQSVGFSSRTSDQLKRLPLSGGAPVLVGAKGGGQDVSATWLPDDTILFSHPTGIMRVPATGGTPALVIPARDGERLDSPRLLPDGDMVLFTARTGETRSLGAVRIVAQRISTGQRTVLVEGGREARYVPTGHLIYVVGNVLMGVAFDARRPAVRGRAVPLVQGMKSSGPSATANYGVGNDGTLVFLYGESSSPGEGGWKLALGDRAGTVTALPLPPAKLDTPRVSPDGKRVALGIADSKENYIAIYDLDGRSALRRLTFGGNSRYPVWSRDGQRVTFQSDREGDRAIFWQRADGASPAERLTKPEKDTAHVPASWSPKDETLLFSVVPAAATDAALGAIWTYTSASGAVERFGGVETATMGPVFSPDGRWVAYASGGTSMAMDGTRKIYVEPFPATGAKYQVPAPKDSMLMSHPFWAPDGAALYFASTQGRFGVVPVTTQPTVAFGNPTELTRRFNSLAPSAPRGFDFTPDGRFVGRIAPDDAPDEAGKGLLQPEIHVVLNWVEELKRLVPVK